MSGALPRYRDLPVHPSKPPRSAWGVWGDDDELGTINLLTPQRVARAAGLVRKGAVFSLNWDLERPEPPLFGRRPLRHTIVDLAPEVGTDDFYDAFYPQASSQWDALSHIGHPEHGFYNGRTLADFTGRPGSRNGIDNWARRGIAGRFVLADVDRYRRSIGRPLDNSQREPIEVDEIEAALAAQGATLEAGDILLVRFGWIAWYESTDREVREAMARAHPVPGLRTPGFSADPRTDEWLWDRHVAAVGTDVPAFEALPYEPTVDGWLHYRVIPLLGLALAELLALDALAQDCAEDGIYEGLLTAAPLNKVGGSGSPANALALK